ncbi:MAG: cohesin domain-containing protein [Geopsychrobacter sp.]|nr:cohesin domain-containing protein [Geopsychrobacter sp.]
MILAGCAGNTSFRKGQQFYSVGDFDNAVVAYKQATAKSPQNAEYKMRLQLARSGAALKHEKKGNDLLGEQNIEGALREYRRAYDLDGSLETSLINIQRVEVMIEANKLVAEATGMLRDRHLKQAQQSINDALGLIADYPPALKLRKELEQSISTVIDGVELEVTSDEPITLNFKAANLVDVFDILTQLSGIKFILDDALRTQTTTLYLEEATFAQAFELLLRMNKLDKKILNSKTIILFPNTKAKKKQFADQVIQTFYLSNIDAKKAVNLLRTMLQVRKIYVHEELNAIVLRDKPEVIKLAQKILEANDRATSEVVFDLELVEVNHTKDLTIGANFPATLGVGLSDPLNPATAIGAITTGTLKNLNFLYNVPSASFDLSKQRGDAEILASPKIRVKNKGKAKVHIGTREPVVTVTTSGSNGEQKSDSVQYVDVGVKLDIEPVIHLDNTIVTKIGLEVSNVSNRETINQGTTVLTISTTNANTELILKDGEQTIIGGLLRDDESKTKVGIPFLSDIPLLGALFTHYKTKKIKRKILLSITPHIVRSVRLPAGDSATIWSGGEDDLRLGRNFGSFVDEYVEGQGKTPNRTVPARAPMKMLIPQSESIAPVAPPVPPQSRVEEPMPMDPRMKKASVGSRSSAPALIKPPQVQVPVARVVPTTPAVAEVVLPGLRLPETISRPTIFLTGDRLVKVGSHFKVSLSVQEVKNLFSAPLYIRFDPKLVDFISASEGPFLGSSGQPTIFTSTQMPGGGRVIVGLKQGAGGSGATGGGVLALLEFKAKAAGKLSIAPERINFRNPAGERMAIDSRGLIVEVK